MGWGRVGSVGCNNVLAQCTGIGRSLHSLGIHFHLFVHCIHVLVSMEGAFFEVVHTFDGIFGRVLCLEIAGGYRASLANASWACHSSTRSMSSKSL